MYRVIAFLNLATYAFAAGSGLNENIVHGVALRGQDKDPAVAA